MICRIKSKKKILALVLVLMGLIPLISTANNREIDLLNDQIEDKREELERLDEEIAKQRQALQSVSGEATTLQSNLNQLEATRKKILSDIKYTETKISEIELTIDKINLEINEKEKLIQQNSEALSESIRKIRQLKEISLVEQVLGYESFSDFWNEFEQTETIQKKLGSEVNTLLSLKSELENKEQEKSNEKEELSEQKVTLASKKVAVEYTQEEKAVLLNKTKNQEAEYQKILNESLERRKAFEAELLEIESKLQTLIDPEGYASARNGILAWPVSGFRITQYFGNTAFAKSNPQFYSSGFHNGVDLAVPIGTNVRAAAAGKIKGFGNTDAFPGCYSWGKWILVEHESGLSTLYAHLSSISVSVGQKVKQGDLIGLSGSSGISTGPHLHFTTYITQGVQIRNYRDVAPKAYGCGAYNVSIPMGSLNSYVDPMDYLPELK
ncbi:MAG TPA: peptidoglycan DD-metalloendopeptidase family protein [Candidatus Paceibacterota bacterium]|nr:peptidoglycan DD-metalloendopeptidase family protein [Candidatus Paceibacterota bacterium]HRZ34561.1 peptidoglycan DD-metalloendopeptidase family protein [Candidatus Paceibacterota bacterium]